MEKAFEYMSSGGKVCELSEYRWYLKAMRKNISKGMNVDKRGKRSES